MTTNQKRRTKGALARGMTLIEIMVVITILGLIAAAVGVAVIPQLDKAKVDRAKLDIGNIQQALTLYYARKGNYPSTGAGLSALAEAQVLPNVPKDPWNNDYVYTLEAGKPVIVSYGRDGQPGGDGLDADISSKDLGAADKNK